MDSAPVPRRAVLSLSGLLVLSACSGSSPPPAAQRTAGPDHAAPLDAEQHFEPLDPPVPYRSRRHRPEFYVDKGPRAIALTIDDGPDPEWTPQVLRLLRHYEVTATFCQVGSRIKAHRGLVRAVAEEGHLIANHTWTHANLAKAAPGVVRSQLERTSDAIEAVTRQRPSVFRAPYGSWSEATYQACKHLGMRPLQWSVDPQDWSRPGISHIVDTILLRTRPGSIILEHDGGGDRSQTLAALSIALPALLDDGFEFVTV